MQARKALIAAALILLPIGAAQAGPRDIVSVASQTSKFTELIEAAELAGVIDALKSEAPITVFAPTDEAFDKLDPQFIDYLVQPENKAELAALLKQHIVPGRLLMADLQTTTEPLSTLLDSRLQVDSFDGTAVRVANARITSSDMLASNGVIHAIDAVLEPKL